MSVAGGAEGITYLDLVRHGAVATPGLFCAPPPEPLSAAGWQQLSATTGHLHRSDYAAILSSPSRRCAEFAAQLAATLGREFECVDGLQEMNFGRWVGQSARAIWQQEETQLTALWQSPLDFVAPDGEAMTDFAERVHSSWAEMVQRFTEQRVLVFTHGGVIRVLLGMALGIPYQNTLGIELAYGSAVRFKVYADGAVSVWGLGITPLKTV